MASKTKAVYATNLRLARLKWGQELHRSALEHLKTLSKDFQFSVAYGDLLLLNASWYVTATGLLRLATRRRCRGIQVQLIPELSDAKNSRYALKATVYKSRTCQGFIGHGDADPSNVSLLVHGAELRVAETRAVNRAIRKAYGIGICSVEELASIAEPPHTSRESKRLQPQPANGNCGSPKVRDRLCELIRRHQLDAGSVKAYAIDFCGTKTLRDATREQVENFVAHLAEQAKKDRDALICQLNGYVGQKEGAA